MAACRPPGGASCGQQSEPDAGAGTVTPATPPTLAGNPGPNSLGDALSMLASARVPAPPTTIPPTPPNVSRTAFYSPSRKMWRDGDGSLFDHQGTAVT